MEVEFVHGQKNVKLIIEYDGTNYAGWQRQKNSLTVQETIEEALHRISGGKTCLTGAGRTDSGVHAKGQVANFHTYSSIPAERYSYALNSELPRDIRIISSVEVPHDFHSRFSSKGKLYRYSIFSAPHGLAIGRDYFYHVHYALDIESMTKAAAYFKGRHDFAGFMSTGSRVKDTIRNIDYATLNSQPPYLYIDIQGDGFLYNMVRIIIGTLLEVGMGKISAEDIPLIISSGRRGCAGPTVPAHGLCLLKVLY